MIRKLFEKLKLIKPRQAKVSKTNVNCGFKDWYLIFRVEISKAYGVDYAICVSSWTFSENFKHYYEKGLTPKQAVLEYAASKNKK